MDNPAVFFPILGVAVLGIICLLLAMGLYLEKKYRQVDRSVPKLRVKIDAVVGPKDSVSNLNLLTATDMTIK